MVPAGMSLSCVTGYELSPSLSWPVIIGPSGVNVMCRGGGRGPSLTGSVTIEPSWLMMYVPTLPRMSANTIRLMALGFIGRF